MLYLFLICLKIEKKDVWKVTIYNMVHRFENQIFAYGDCPIAISNGYTECTNRLIRENNLRGRGYSFEVLCARTLYRKTNLRAMLEKGLIDVGPVIPEEQSVFHFESAREDEDEDLEDDYESFPNPEEFSI